MNKTTQNILLLLGVVVLALIPFAIHLPAGGTGDEAAAEMFAGSDGQAEELITRMHPEYKPWFSSFWEPPSGEIESLLFSLQAAIGSGLLFYYIGYHRGRKTVAKT
jgi:cobalt/nickel transport protein